MDDGLGAFNHGGIKVSSTDEVLATKLRLKHAGLATFDEMDTECCYARQDKIWVTDPDGTPWEVFTVLEDVEHDAPATPRRLLRVMSVEVAQPGLAHAAAAVRGLGALALGGPGRRPRPRPRPLGRARRTASATSSTGSSAR